MSMLFVKILPGYTTHPSHLSAVLYTHLEFRIPHGPATQGLIADTQQESSRALPQHLGPSSSLMDQCHAIFLVNDFQYLREHKNK